MLNFASVFWFVPRNIKNNLIYFTGNFFIFAVFYLILSSYYLQLRNFKLGSLLIFSAFSLTAIIYNFIFYFKHSKRLGLLVLYGIGKVGLFFVVLLENLLVMFFAVLVNIAVEWTFDVVFLLIAFGFVFLIAVICCLRYFFTDVYQLIKGSF